MAIDLMSISGHKLYGPKGVGALYVRRRPRVRIEALQSGGGQERGLRSGTVPTPLCVGLGVACEVAQQEMAYDHARITKLSRRLVDQISANLPQVIRNGDTEQTYPGCVNLSFAYVEGESLLMALKGNYLRELCREYFKSLIFCCYRCGTVEWKCVHVSFIGTLLRTACHWS